MIFQRHPIVKSPLQEDVHHSEVREADIKAGGSLEVIKSLEHRTMIQSLDTIQDANRILQQILDFMRAHDTISQQVSKVQRPGMRSTSPLFRRTASVPNRAGRLVRADHR